MEVSSEKVAVALGLARVGDSWSHKASTPSNKNMVGDDGPFRHGPNEPPASKLQSSPFYLCMPPRTANASIFARGNRGIPNWLRRSKLLVIGGASSPP